MPDPLWERIERVLNELDPPARTGRRRIAPRPALDGIVYQERTGSQWNALPHEFGHGGSVHRTLQRWIGKGVMERIRPLLADQCKDLGDADR